MSGFSADWLALREEADQAARSERVLDAVRADLADSISSPFSVCDLGSGTGAAARAFSELFPKPQRWRLVDLDAANLDRAASNLSGADAIEGLEVNTHVHDLNADCAPWEPRTDIVTTTAFFDLTSADWLEGFADRLAEDQLPLLATLTYDGRHVFSPMLPLDQKMIDGFNTHQKTDKGFGPAAGPEAATTLVRLLKERGYDVTTADSSWHLEGKRDAVMLHTLLEGWCAAMIDSQLVGADDANGWLESRKSQTTSLQVGHTDIFARVPVD